MKKLLFFAVFISCSLLSMEPQESHIDKLKVRVSASSGSSSGSGGQVSGLESIDLHRDGSPTIDTARLEQEGKIVIRNMDDLARVLKDRGLQIVDNTGSLEEKRASIVYMPEIPALNMASITRDISNQSKGRTTPDLEKGESSSSEPDFEKMFEFYSNYLKEKKNKDISQVKNRMIEKFKKAHNTPPASPQSSPKDKKHQKAKKAVQALHSASYYRETARTKRTQDIQKNSKMESSRAPKATEVFNALSGLPLFKDPEVHSGLEAMEELAFKLLSQKLAETQSSKTTTTWITAGIGAVTTIGSALITYFTTKNSNNNC